MEKMMQRLTMDKASQYRQKAIGTVRARIEDLVCTNSERPEYNTGVALFQGPE